MKILSKRARVDINLAEQKSAFDYIDVPRLVKTLRKVCPFTDAAFAGGYDPVAGIKEYTELARCKNDPMYFISTFCSLPKLYSYQKELIQLAENNHGVIAKHPRQAGITSTALAYALWMAIFHPCKSILLGAVSHSQAMDLRSKISSMLENLPKWMVPGIRYANRNCTEFDNGSAIRYQAVSEHFGRGISFSLCYLDSFALVKPELQEYVWDCVVPTVVTGGKIIVASTPGETDTCFHSLWCNAVEGVGPLMPLSIDYAAMPYASATHWIKTQDMIGLAAMKREYNAEFVEALPEVDLLDKITGIRPTPAPANLLLELPSPEERDLGITEARYR